MEINVHVCAYIALMPKSVQLPRGDALSQPRMGCRALDAGSLYGTVQHGTVHFSTVHCMVQYGTVRFGMI